MRDSRAQASDMRGTENGLLYGPSQIVSPGGNSTFGILRLGDALMDASYNLNGGFNPALKRFADLDGPDFFPTPDWATYALIDNESFQGESREPHRRGRLLGPRQAQVLRCVHRQWLAD